MAPEPPEPRDTVELTDPRALRALAHPTRLKLVALLRRHGPMTATQAGERLGESPASCSYHLRQLAAWDLVEEAGGGRGRARPWRATARSTSWQITGPEVAEPSAALSAIVARSQMEEMLRAIDRLPTEAPAWQRAQQLTDTQLMLTPEQLEELGRRLLELFEAYRDLPEASGARRVGLFFAAYALPDEASSLRKDASLRSKEDA